MANGIYNYGQGRTSIKNRYLNDDDWYNFDQSPMGAGDS